MEIKASTCMNNSFAPRHFRPPNGQNQVAPRGHDGPLKTEKGKEIGNDFAQEKVIDKN
jgi:hypothetical protein